MVNCCVPMCTHRSENTNLVFYSIPKDQHTRKRWVQVIRRKNSDGSTWEPTSSSRICSWHFSKGRMHGYPDRFAWTEGGQPFQYEEPPMNKRRKLYVPGPGDEIIIAASSTNVSENSAATDKLLENTTAAKQAPVKLKNTLSKTAKPQNLKTANSENREMTKTVVRTDQRHLQVKIAQTAESNKQIRGENVEAANGSHVLNDKDIEHIRMRKKIKRLQNKLKSNSFKFSTIKDENIKVYMYTGLDSEKAFRALCKLMSRFHITYYFGWEPAQVSREDQLFMTLIKLRMNLPNLDLAVRFNCSSKAVSNITITWIHAFHEVLFEGFMTATPSLLKNQACFSSLTRNKMVLDFIKVFIETPSKNDTDTLEYEYTNYKGRNSFKALVGVAPNGVLTFASGLYLGFANENSISSDCGVVSHTKAGDLILVDKGFLVRDIVPSGVSLKLPLFLDHPSEYLNLEEAVPLYVIDRTRIHMELAVERLRGYRILDLIPQKYRPFASLIFQACCALTNLQYFIS